MDKTLKSLDSFSLKADKEAERTEYRLVCSHLKAKMAAEALTHCYASLGQKEKAQKEVATAEELFGKIPTDSRQWCLKSLEKMKRLPASA